MSSFYYPELNSDTKIAAIQGSEFHHLINVMRNKVGDSVKLNSGKGYLATGTIISIDRKKAEIELNESIFIEPVKNPFAIAFSLLKNKSDEWLVEKVTELGVKHLFPIKTQYSVRTPSANTLSKFKLITLSTIKQCDNPYLPFISEIQTLKVFLKTIRQFGYEPVVASEKRPGIWLDDLQKDKSYCYIIGAEGGFSLEEFTLMIEYGVIEISISQLILRAETAAVTVAAQHSLLSK